jgi:hypothetical protein
MELFLLLLSPPPSSNPPFFNLSPHRKCLKLLLLFFCLRKLSLSQKKCCLPQAKEGETFKPTLP